MSNDDPIISPGGCVHVPKSFILKTARTLPHGSFRVLIALLAFEGANGWSEVPSYTLCTAAGCSPGFLFRHLKKLEKSGLISRERTKAKRGFDMNRYRVSLATEIPSVPEMKITSHEITKS